MLGIIRISILFICVNLTTIFGFFYCLLFPFSKTKAYAVTLFFAKTALLFTGLKVEVRGKENLKNGNANIIISNHQSFLDVLTCPLIAPSNTVSVGKKSIIFIPIYGFLYYLTGNILIDRKNTKSAIKTMEYIANTVKSKKLSIWIMPEGTRNRKASLLPFKKGPFYAAVSAKVPIVPVAISRYETTISFNRLNIGKIIVEALPPISTENLQKDDIKLMTIKTQKLVEDKVTSLTDELEQIG